MKRIIALSSLLLVGSGCMSPLTRRLDLTNQQLATTNAQLAETNQRLGDTQARLIETNQRVANLEGKLDESNRRVGLVDQAIQKLLPGLNLKP